MLFSNCTVCTVANTVHTVKKANSLTCSASKIIQPSTHADTMRTHFLECQVIFHFYNAFIFMVYPE